MLEFITIALGTMTGILLAAFVSVCLILQPWLLKLYFKKVLNASNKITEELLEDNDKAEDR